MTGSSLWEGLQQVQPTPPLLLPPVNIVHLYAMISITLATPPPLRWETIKAEENKEKSLFSGAAVGEHLRGRAESKHPPGRK